MILPKFYCPTCKKLKHVWEVKKQDDFRCYWYECRWCHKQVTYTKDVVEDIINVHERLNEIRNSTTQPQKNGKWRKTDDGWFEFYINVETGEKKLTLGHDDILIE